MIHKANLRFGTRVKNYLGINFRRCRVIGKAPWRHNKDGTRTRMHLVRCRCGTERILSTSNTRNVRLIEHNGDTRSVAQWSRLLGISEGGLVFRLRKWPVEIALTLPVGARRGTNQFVTKQQDQHLDGVE